jgi:hypothetical protein
MPVFIVRGFKSFSSQDVGEEIYSGGDGVEANEAIAKNGRGYVRIGKLVNPQFIPVAIPTEPEPTAQPAETPADILTNSKPKGKKA